MQKTTPKQKILLITFGIFLTLILLEVVLRISGNIFFIIQETNNARYYKEKGTITILCLGESTTALLGKHSYPRQLENILNNKNLGVKFHVINKGVPATLSSAIVKGLRSNVAKYNPDIVVVMMGINDVIYSEGFLKAHHEDLSKDIPFLIRHMQRLKLYRLYKLLSMHFDSRNNKAFAKESNDYYDKDNWLKDKILKFEYAKNFSNTAVNLRNKNKIKESIFMFRKAILVNPQDISIYMELARTLLKEKDFVNLEKLYLKSIEANPNNFWGYNSLAHFYNIQGRSNEADTLNLKAQVLRNQYYNTTIRKNYLELKEILDEQSIKLVCVQYPMVEINSLKKIFPDTKDIVFVDNESVFKDAVERSGYGVYFTDSFAGNFGHCTKDGNSLLAENVAKQIVKSFLNAQFND